MQKLCTGKNKPVEIKIEIAYVGERASLGHVGGKTEIIIPLTVKSGTKLIEAILQSGILEQFKELGSDPAALEDRVGIFSEIKTLDTILQEGDRVEIYRSLKIDPKEARRARAKRENKHKREQKLQQKREQKRGQ